jgi:hypothetical protein
MPRKEGQRATPEEVQTCFEAWRGKCQGASRFPMSYSWRQ